MLRLLNKFKRNLLQQGKFKSFLLYTLGEVFLVVIGILIALQIDNLSDKEKSHKREIENYKEIISDLKKDSVMLATRIARAKFHQDTYYALNDIANGKAEIDETAFYDFIVMNITFDPITKSNHQRTIQELEDHNFRNDLNSYFANEYRVKEASIEFNLLIGQASRPFFLEEMDVFDNEAIFNVDKYKFPPSLRVRGLDPRKIEKAMNHKKFRPIISELRMSMGWFLAEIEDLSLENAKLIKALEIQINK